MHRCGRVVVPSLNFSTTLEIHIDPTIYIYKVIILALVDGNDRWDNTHAHINFGHIHTSIQIIASNSVCTFPKRYWLAEELKYLQLLSVSRTLGFGHVIRVQVNHKISFPKAFWLVPFRSTCDLISVRSVALSLSLSFCYCRLTIQCSPKPKLMQYTKPTHTQT